MIEAKDLRIGNLVYGYENIIETIHAIQFNVDTEPEREVLFLPESGYRGAPVDEISPIPLTPEWLEKFGFQRENFLNLEGVYEIGNVIVSVGEGSGSIAIRLTGFVPNVVLLNQDLKYVHTLQNWHCLLTGSELTIQQQEAK